MEIVFSDSEAGSMKMAANYDAKAIESSMIGYIGDQESTEAELGDHFAGRSRLRFDDWFSTGYW